MYQHYILERPVQIMTNENSEQQSQRLASLYSDMADAELLKLDEDPTSLTSVAQEALHGEISRRGLVSLPGQSPATDELELRKLVTLRQFRDLPEALMAKGALESAGIESFLADDNMVRLDWFLSNLIGGIKIKVKPEDLEAAQQILDQPIPAGFEVEGVGDYQQPSCPRCGSLDVTFQQLNQPVAYGSAWLRLPFPVHYKAWHCRACDNEWKNAAPDAFPEP
jgi:Putative prokaryotic signal transducing protein